MKARFLICIGLSLAGYGVVRAQTLTLSPILVQISFPQREGWGPLVSKLSGPSAWIRAKKRLSGGGVGIYVYTGEAILPSDAAVLGISESMRVASIKNVRVHGLAAQQLISSRRTKGGGFVYHMDVVFSARRWFCRVTLTTSSPRPEEDSDSKNFWIQL